MPKHGGETVPEGRSGIVHADELDDVIVVPEVLGESAFPKPVIHGMYHATFAETRVMMTYTSKIGIAPKGKCEYPFDRGHERGLNGVECLAHQVVVDLPSVLHNGTFVGYGYLPASANHLRDQRLDELKRYVEERVSHLIVLM